MMFLYALPICIYSMYCLFMASMPQQLSTECGLQINLSNLSNLLYRHVEPLSAEKYTKQSHVSFLTRTSLTSKIKLTKNNIVKTFEQRKAHDLSNIFLPHIYMLSF